MTQQSPDPFLEYRKSPEGIREIAQRQRAIIFCILGILIVYGSAMVGQNVLPPAAILAVVGIIIAIEIVAFVFVFLLTTKLYGVAVGILLGLAPLLPCIGLITLLVINAKATAILKEASLKVGLRGATMPPSV